ncbi:MAG TPA: hypothetical protein VKA87_07640 [Nitrososphaeraceae archaeon]|nr:hypothetical protein [Nitrososphaeraceae archaeon]
MSTVEENSDNKNTGEDGNGQFPPVPEGAIVKPEQERPVKMQMRPEENLEEREADIESADTGSEDMDGDGSPDWDPAVGPGV